MDEPSRGAGANRPDDAAARKGGADDGTEELPLFARGLRIKSLAERIGELAAGFEDGGFPNRDEVADGVLLPILLHLGWDIADTRVVAPGFETPAGTVDFALCHPPGEPRVLVSIGALPGSTADSGDHPFEDTSIPALQVTVAEDGREWAIHFPAGRGSMRNRRFARFDVADDPTEDAAGILDTYLSFHAVRSGDAFRMAALDYAELRFPAEAHGAWRRALKGREVRHRFLRELKEAVGVPADRDRAQEFIAGQIGSVEWPADPPDPQPARRVQLGDKVYVYDFESREIVVRVVVGSDPDWGNGEVSRESAFGHALLGAHEGDVRNVKMPGGQCLRMRIVLIVDG